MTKSKLIELIHQKKPNLSTEEITRIVDLIFGTMGEGLSRGKRIEIRGFGSFSLRERAARENARDPRTGERIQVEKRWITYFRLGKGFFDKINNT